jgi:hypothetical protein
MVGLQVIQFMPLLYRITKKFLFSFGSYQDLLDRGLLLTWKLLNKDEVTTKSFAVLIMTWLTVTFYNG